MGIPKQYRSMQEFEREELKPHFKIGFSFDDLMQETMLGPNELLFDDMQDDLIPERTTL